MPPIFVWKAIKVINKLSSEVNIETAMNNAREIALELLDCEKVTLFLVDEVKKELRCKVHPALISCCH